MSLFLGFHTLGIYVHNDVVMAFGHPERQILIEPIFAQWIQAASGKMMYGMSFLLSDPNSAASLAAESMPGNHYWMSAMNDQQTVCSYQ